MAWRDPESLQRLATLCVQTCLGVRAGERVVVVTDRENQDRADALVAAAAREGTEPLVVVLPPFRPYAKDPPAAAVAAMKAADVVLVALSQLAINQFVHTSARRDVLQAGARIGNVFLPEGDWAVSEADILHTRDETRRLADLLTAAGTARVTSPVGTDVTMDLTRRAAIAVSSVQKAPGGWASIPDFAEAAIAPVEGSAQGVAVIEGSVTWLGRLAGPVRLRIEAGRILAIEGGEDARRLEAVFAGGDAAARSVAELGIGTVPRGEIRGENLDKRLLGTAHLGFGDNHSIGGQQRSTMHLDALMCGVTVTLDGRPVVRGGRLVLGPTGC